MSEPTGREILDAVHSLEKRFIGFEAKNEAEHTALEQRTGSIEQALVDDHAELKARVDRQGREIDQINIKIAKNKEKAEAQMRNQRWMFATIGVVLFAVEIGVLIFK